MSNTKTNKVGLTAFLNSQIDFCKNMEEVEASNKSIIYIIGEGAKVFEVRKNEIGTFVSEAKEIKGSNNDISEGFIPKLPPIPFNILLQFVSLFRDVCDFMNNDEALMQIFWDKKNEQYVPICPTQTTTTTNVSFLADKDKSLSDDYTHVMDIHSHNSMNAFFSSTDDSSEKANKLYGVFGHLNKDKHEYKFRTCNNGKYLELNVFDIFERPKVSINFGEFQQEIELSEDNIMFPQVDYPAEWLEKIKQGKAERDKIKAEVNSKSFDKHNFHSKAKSSKRTSILNDDSLFNHHQSQLDFEDFPYTTGKNPHVPKKSAKTSMSLGYDDETTFDTLGVDNVEELSEKIGDLSLFEFKMLIDLLYDQGLAEEISDVLKRDYGLE